MQDRRIELNTQVSENVHTYIHTHTVRTVIRTYIGYVCTYIVESPNKGHFGTVILSFVRRLSFNEKSKMY